MRLGLLILTDWQVYLIKDARTYEGEELLHRVAVLHVLLVDLVLRPPFPRGLVVALVRHLRRTLPFQSVGELDDALSSPGGLRLELKRLVAGLAVDAVDCVEIAGALLPAFALQALAGSPAVRVEAGLALHLANRYHRLTLARVLIFLGLHALLVKREYLCLRARVDGVRAICLALGHRRLLKVRLRLGYRELLQALGVFGLGHDRGCLPVHLHEGSADKHTHARLAPEVAALGLACLGLSNQVVIELVDDVIRNDLALSAIRQLGLDVLVLGIVSEIVLVLKHFKLV